MNTHKTRGPVYIHVKISSCVKQVRFHFEKLILSRSVYSESLIFKIFFVYKYTDLKFLNNVRVCLLQQTEKFWTAITLSVPGMYIKFHTNECVKLVLNYHSVRLI